MRYFLHLFKTSVRASMGNRGAFIFQSLLMMFNNLVFFVLWLIFFRKFPSIGGWSFNDMIVLWVVGIGGYGIAQVLFGGSKQLAKNIVNGKLDGFLTQPKNVLLNIVISESRVKGWGHILTALFLLPFLKGVSGQVVLLLFVMMVCAAVVFGASAMIVHSSAFWLGSIQMVAKRYCDSLFLFALYPTNIYSGLLQLAMFTVIPAGIIGYIPVELFRSFSWIRLLLLLASTTIYCGLAFFVFYRGLRRYESGNLFTFN